MKNGRVLKRGGNSRQAQRGQRASIGMGDGRGGTGYSMPITIGLSRIAQLQKIHGKKGGWSRTVGPYKGQPPSGTADNPVP